MVLKETCKSWTRRLPCSSKTGETQEVLAKTEHKKKKGTDNKPPELFSDQKKNLYQNLFYLLQTEPKYLANLLYLCSPEEMHEFLDTVILTLFGDAYSPREEFLILSLFKVFVLKALLMFLLIYTFAAYSRERIEELGCSR
jgi:Ras GTPase-activating-like protein IQGAP2/3